jgi:hypothetical protein
MAACLSVVHMWLGNSVTCSSCRKQQDSRRHAGAGYSAGPGVSAAATGAAARRVQRAVLCRTVRTPEPRMESSSSSSSGSSMYRCILARGQQQTRAYTTQLHQAAVVSCGKWGCGELGRSSGKMPQHVCLGFALATHSAAACGSDAEACHRQLMECSSSGSAMRRDYTAQQQQQQRRRRRRRAAAVLQQAVMQHAEGSAVPSVCCTAVHLREHSVAEKQLCRCSWLLADSRHPAIRAAGHSRAWIAGSSEPLHKALSGCFCSSLCKQPRSMRHS